MSRAGVCPHNRAMNWKSIRLELARTDEFPEGSASRAFLLHLPLREDGLIDEETLGGAPVRATVHRFWPNERDRAGHVIRTPRGWAFSYRAGEEDDRAVFHLETHPIRMGEFLTLTEPDGRQLPFRVACLKRLS